MAEERFPPYFSVDDDQGSILVNSSQLAEFVAPQTPSDPAKTINQLRTHVLNAPSVLVAPLSAGLIKLRVKNGPETF